MNRKYNIMIILISISFIGFSSILIYTPYQYSSFSMSLDCQSQNCVETLNEPLTGIDYDYEETPSLLIHDIKFIPFDNSTSIPHASAFDQVDLYGLLVGVENYPGSDSDLRYCIEDIDSIQSLLETQFHADPSKLYILKDSQATKSAIQTKISEIAQLMDENDYFFFYYSGHGGPSLITHQYSWSAQSTHPYSNNMDSYWHYQVSGVDLMRVHFTKIDVETGYDAIYVGDNKQREYFYDMFSGYYTDIWSYYVESNDIYVNLYSDYSNTYWGFAVDQVETVTFVGPYYINPYDGLDIGLSGSSLDSYFDLIPGKIIGIMDSCYSGGVGAALSASNRYIVGACTQEESSLEDTVYHHGVFTDQFLKAWNTAGDNNLDGALSFEEVFPVAQTGTIQRSTAIGYTHNPVQFDSISGVTVLDPTFSFHSYAKLSSTMISLSFYHYGLGYGTLSFTYYDFNEYSYSSMTIESDMLSSPLLQTHSYGIPSGIDGLYVTANIQYNNYIEFANYNVNVTGYYIDPFLDSDFDNITDFTEYSLGINPWLEDTDNDDLSDYDEIYVLHSNVLLNDTDGDLLSDGDEHNVYFTDIFDTDTDDDSLLDGEEILIYMTDPVDPDTDMDEIPDGDEVQLGLDPLSTDTDGDTLHDGDELYIYLTDPLNTDTDEDGLSDNTELASGLNPTKSDTDNDQLNDGVEVNVYLTNPLDSDTDNDGLSDGLEVIHYSTNPLNTDSDNDGVTDGSEVYKYFTDPLSEDSDQDGLSDNFEISSGLNPNKNDTDNDGLTDIDEINEFNTDPTKADSDLDGIFDDDEVLVYHSNPNLSDSDKDGLSDYDEIMIYFTNPVQVDSDLDGFPDQYEIQHRYNAMNPFDSPLFQVYLVLEIGIVVGISLIFLKKYSHKHPATIPSISQERPSYEVKIHRKKKIIYSPPSQIQRPVMTSGSIQSPTIASQMPYSMRTSRPWFYSFIPPQLQAVYPSLSYDQQLEFRKDLAVAYELAVLHEFGPAVVQRLPRCRRCNCLLANIKCFYCDN